MELVVRSLVTQPVLTAAILATQLVTAKILVLGQFARFRYVSTANAVENQRQWHVLGDLVRNRTRVSSI